MSAVAWRSGIDRRSVTTILTGGLSAAAWATGIEGIDAIDPELTLRGLAVLHAEVSGGQVLELGLEALARNTAKLPRVELRVPERAIGTNTEDAMRSGAIHGYIGLARELLERTRAELAAGEGVEPSLIRTVATGGLAHQPWVAEIGAIEPIDPDLTLKGLAILYQERSWRPDGTEDAAAAADVRVGEAAS